MKAGKGSRLSVILGRNANIHKPLEAAFYQPSPVLDRRNYGVFHRVLAVPLDVE